MSDSIYARQISNLVNAYLELFPLDREFLGHLPIQLQQSGEPLSSRANFSGHLTAAALILDNNEEKVLLIKHKFLERWLQPGGHLEWQEEPMQGALREAREETGLVEFQLHPWHQPNLIPLDIDSHAIPANPNKRELSHYHHDFLYVFRYGGKEKLSLQLDEVSDHKWVTLADLETGNFGKRLARAAIKFKRLTN
ncbi:MAG: NUDIX domain-containing protein [Candidatus Obscuribacterales bacterium]|nr:NUDIX domain-containing protein [Candidatus Obscuribacterales bacterium]